jgi:hypothetical protein
MHMISGLGEGKAELTITAQHDVEISNVKCHSFSKLSAPFGTRLYLQGHDGECLVAPFVEAWIQTKVQRGSFSQVSLWSLMEEVTSILSSYPHRFGTIAQARHAF